MNTDVKRTRNTLLLSPVFPLTSNHCYFLRYYYAIEFVFYSMLKVETGNEYEVLQAKHSVGQESFQKSFSTKMEQKKLYYTMHKDEQ